MANDGALNFEEEIAITLLSGAETPVWTEFARCSPTATLFHDLDFLGYHPAGRFDFHHLVFRREGRVVGLLPGALRRLGETTEFVSPAGASIGGMVLAGDCRLALADELTDSLLRHGRREGWARIALTLAPAIYNGRLAALPSFVLSRSGFNLVNRQACFVLKLTPRREKGFADFFRPTQATSVRAARRAGVVVSSGSGELLASFLSLLDDTFARHGSAPTHSHAELAWLTKRFPDRVRFYVASLNGEPIGALGVFLLSSRVATTFYICTGAGREKNNGAIAAMAQLIDDLSAAGFDWLDLGPSADHMRANFGVARFKEGLGAEYHLRESWVADLARDVGAGIAGRCRNLVLSPAGN